MAEMISPLFVFVVFCTILAMALLNIAYLYPYYHTPYKQNK